MKNKNRGFIRKLIIFSIPFLAFIGSYFIADPFHVLRIRDNYGSNYLQFFNRNVVSTSTYLRYNDEYHFDSFIFGSSRSSAFQTTDWQNYIRNGSPYHFDAFNENISGIEAKLNFIAQKGNIKNVIIVLDQDSFIERFEEMGSLPHLKDPRWNGKPNLLNKEWWSFQFEYFQSFFKNSFILKYFDSLIFHKYRPWFEGTFSKYDSYYFQSPHNDFTFPMHIEEMEQDSVLYYKNPRLFKSERKVKMYDRLIRKVDLPNFEAIAKIFKENNTDYRIIIGPTYTWNEYNVIDLEILKIYFDPKKIYNYSGKNKYTEFEGNFYDDSHYKPLVGRAILKEIYQPAD